MLQCALEDVHVTQTVGQRRPDEKTTLGLRPRQPAASVLANRRFHRIPFRPVQLAEPRGQAIDDSSSQRFEGLPAAFAHTRNWKSPGAVEPGGFARSESQLGVPLTTPFVAIERPGGSLPGCFATLKAYPPHVAPAFGTGRQNETGG